jgi:hypothetical protein
MELIVPVDLNKKVLLKELKLYGHIDRISYDGAHIRYCVCFYSEGRRHEEWVRDFEFEITNENL